MKTGAFSFLIFILLISLCTNAQAPSEAWARTAGGTGNDIGTSIAVDHHGGVYISGSFKSPTFTIGTATLTNAGGADIFIAKYDTAGNFQWAKRFGGTGSETVRKMALSPDGSIYITDSFRTSITIDTFSVTATSQSNIYIAKLDGGGNLQWARQITGLCLNPDITVDATGFLYLAGENGTAITNPGDAFINKYSNTGTLVNSIAVNSGYYLGSIFPFVAIDKVNNVHLAFYHGVSFQTRNWYNSSGVLLGSQPITGETRFYARSIRAKAANEFYYSGEFINLSGANTIRFGGNLTSFEPFIGCVKKPVNTDIDNAGNQFLAGSVNASPFPPECNGGSYTLTSTAINPPTGSYIQGSTGVDIFFTSRSSGNPINFLSSTKNNGYTNETPNQIAFDTAGNCLYAVGYWSKIHDTSKFYFGNSTLVNAGNGATTDMLLLKLRFPSNSLSLNAGTDRTICFGGSAVIGGLASGGSGPYTYNWSPATGLSSTTVAKPIANPIATTSYIVMVTDGSGASVTDTVNVTVDPAMFVPVIAIGTGSNPFCEGGSVTLTTTPGAVSYLWNSGSVNSNVTVSSPDTLTVTVVNASGCIGTSAPYIVTVTPRTATPTILLSGSASLCQGESRTLTAQSLQLPATFMWNNGATSQSINTNIAGTYSVRATGPNGCQSLPATVAININPLPTGSIAASGNTSFCNGDSVLLTIATAAGNSILWSNGNTTSTIWAKTAGVYSATITSPQGCSITTNNIVITVVQPPQAPTINAAGPTSFCSGGSVMLTAQHSQAGLNFMWSTGATTAAITANSSGVFSVTAANSTGCVSAAASINVVVNTNPTGMINAGGNTTFCQGDSVLLSGTTAPGNSVLWNTGSTASSIWAKNNGTYNATIISPQGCSITTNSILVTVNPLPPAPTINASGPVTICTGQSVTLTAQNTQSGASYLWSTGATTSSITVTTGGTFSVRTMNTNGCSSASSAPATVVVNSLPTGSIAANGNTAICNGDSVQLAINTAPGNGYSWSNGATTPSIWVKSAGSFSALISSPQGCSKTTNSIAVTVKPLPVPVISQSGNVLTVTGAQTYQWFYDGTAIPGATSQSFTITQGGNYSVTVTSNGCSASESWSAVQRNANDGITYQVYPNPSQHQINVVYTLTETKRVTVKIFNITGQRIFTIVDNQMQNPGDHFYSIRNSSLRLQPGYYVLTIEAGNTKVQHRVIVL